MRNPFVVLALLAGLATSSAAEAPLSLPDLLLRARDHNPEIAASRQAYKAAQNKVGPAGAWPDPTFTYIAEKFPSGIPGEDPMSMRHYRIEQMIPFPGKMSGESKMQLHEAIMAEADYRAKALDVFRDVSMRYYQLFLTDQKMDLAGQSVEILKNVLKTAQTRLGSGQSSASDVFMAETELRKMENNLYQLRQGRQVTAIELNSLLNQPTETPLGKPQRIDLIGRQCARAVHASTSLT
jgi:outer membrane protein TolC